MSLALILVSVLAALLLAIIRCNVRAARISVHTSPDASNELLSVLGRCLPKSISQFKPPPILSIDSSGHLHTIIGSLLREAYVPGIAVHRVKVPISDGSTVALDFLGGSERLESNGEGPLDTTPSQSTVPTVILLHGMSGDSQVFYIRSLAHHLRTERGWRVICMVARGCGEGDLHVPLTAPGPHHGGRTQDFREALQHVRQLYPLSPLFSVGYSLGAGVLGLYCVEEGENNILSGATLVNPCFNYTVWAKTFTVWSRLYLGKTLVYYAKQNREGLGQHPDANLDSIFACKSVFQYSEKCIVPICGFKDAMDYFRQISMGRGVARITIPTLAVVSYDDPVMDIRGVPSEEIFGPGLAVVKTRTGGHCVGAEGWRFSKGPSWYDRMILDWVDGCIKVRATSGQPEPLALTISQSTPRAGQGLMGLISPRIRYIVGSRATDGRKGSGDVESPPQTPNQSCGTSDYGASPLSASRFDRQQTVPESEDGTPQRRNTVADSAGFGRQHTAPESDSGSLPRTPERNTTGFDRQHTAPESEPRTPDRRQSLTVEVYAVSGRDRTDTSWS